MGLITRNVFNLLSPSFFLSEHAVSIVLTNTLMSNTFVLIALFFIDLNDTMECDRLHGMAGAKPLTP
jgi:hypothetical protein